MATETTIIRTTRRRYHWPELQLNLWIFVMLAASATVLGMFAWFITVQKQLTVGIPWLFTFGVVTASLTLLFIACILGLAANRMLLPGAILLGSFILFVLWLTALIETSIQLYGPQGNVNANCNAYVAGQEYTGVSVETLAWITQSNICACWRAIFAWEIVAVVLFFWMMILSWQVNTFDD